MSLPKRAFVAVVFGSVLTVAWLWFFGPPPWNVDAEMMEHARYAADITVQEISVDVAPRVVDGANWVVGYAKENARISTQKVSEYFASLSTALEATETMTDSTTTALPTEMLAMELATRTPTVMSGPVKLSASVTPRPVLRAYTVTLTPTSSPAPVPPTATPTSNLTPTSSPTPVPPTATPTATLTPTLIPTDTPVPPPTGGVYVVQTGDSPASIAAKYGTIVEEILAANGLSGKQFIWLGQELLIPQPGQAVRGPVTPRASSVAVTLSTAATSVPSVERVIHIVQPGEVLHSIASSYNITIDAIIEANDLVDANRIEKGQELIIPTTAVAGAPRPTATKPGERNTPGRAAKEAGLTGKIVFQNAIGQGIYIINADGSGLTYLAQGMEPSLSPDGKRIVFTRWGEGEGIYTINTDGSDEKMLFAIRQPRQATWSPDGSRVAFSYQNGSRDTETRDKKEDKVYTNTVYFWRVAIVGADGNGFTELPTNSDQSFSPTWSPDGKFVANAAGEGLVVSAPDGFHRVLTHAALQQSPAWSPDGGNIVYMWKRHDHFEIFRRSFQGDLAAEQRFLTSNKGIDQVALTNQPLYVDVPVNNVCPVWSPDGRHVAFLSDRDGRWDIYVMNPDGSEQRKMFESGLGDVRISYDFAGDKILSWGK